VLGSNVVNVALILGLALSWSGIRSQRDRIKRDFAGALLVPIVTGALAIDGVLSRWDGVVLLGLFCVWLGLTIREGWRDRAASESSGDSSPWVMTIAQNVAGLVLLVAAGSLIVLGAKGIAHGFGISDFIIGATVVAVGTSVPELATTLIAKFRGHDEVGLGAVLGSNIFNGLFIVGVVAVMAPIRVNWNVSAIALALSMVAVACTFPNQTGWIGRRRGIVLLGLYVIYLGLILTA
jgi:cation:H+ antiporter